LFLVVISAEGLMMRYLLSYYVALYSLTAVSFIGYAIWVARFISRKSLTQKDSYTGERAMFLKSSRYLLVIMACLFTVSVLMDVMPEDEKIQIKLTAITVYAGMLATMCITFRYKVRSVFTKVTVYSQKQKIPIAKENEHVIRHLSAPQKYLKSGLTQDMVEEYKKRLDNSFEKEQVFLDSSLTLEALAKHLKMPPHHLTQIFNVYIGENFNQYMNKYRIEYASLLLANNKEDSTIEDIAFSSGFNNKVSFNRHFKNLMGCTPKEFANNDKAES
jgi:AraC-like DNA-binding protein